MLKKVLLLVACLCLAGMVSAQEINTTNYIEWTFNETAYSLELSGDDFSFKRGNAVLPVAVTETETPGVFAFTLSAQNTGNAPNPSVAFRVFQANFGTPNQAHQSRAAANVMLPALEPDAAPTALYDYQLGIGPDMYNHPHLVKGDFVLVFGSFMVTDGLPHSIGGDKARMIALKVPRDEYETGRPSGYSSYDPGINPDTAQWLGDNDGKDWGDILGVAPHIPLAANIQAELLAEVMAGTGFANKANLDDPSGLMYGKIALNIYPFLSKILADLAFFSGEGDALDLSRELFFEVPIEQTA